MKYKINKIKGLDELSQVCADLREEGKKTVLCHGVFDLLHIGHMRHFEVAKKNGDILVVTITGDHFVNKGPDRPVFPSELRLEMLASMEIVDYVAVIEDHSAKLSIKTVKPSIYVKGGEYSNHEDDVTGKITMETDLVESFGGKVIYTEDITFSSSNLLNNHFNLIDKPARSFITNLREEGGVEEIDKCFGDISGLKVLMVGEAIIDEYQYVSPMGKAAKENIIATHYAGMERFAGGIIAAANHISQMCESIEVMTIVGDGIEDSDKQQRSYEHFIRDSLSDNIELNITKRIDSPTTRKVRFVEPTYIRKLFEVYHMDDTPLADDVRTKFHDDLSRKAREVDIVIVCDFGHGFMDPQAIEIVEREAKFLAVNVQSNSANTGYNLITKYRRADILCVDAMEARLATRDKHSSIEQISNEQLPRLINCPSIIVTHGKNGCYTYDSETRQSVHIPAFKRNVVDTIGAGDAFFVFASLFSCVGANNATSAFVGNVAGGLKVSVVGHRNNLTKLQLQRTITTLMK